MLIEFPHSIAPKITAMGTVSFQAKIDDEFIWCEISFEALQHHFGDPRRGGYDLLQAFHSGRNKIEGAARQHLEINGCHPVLLTAFDF